MLCTFCLTIGTTVGYGDTASSTVYGRLLFIFYVLPGICVCGAMIGEIGMLIHGELQGGKVIFSLYNLIYVKPEIYGPKWSKISMTIRPWPELVLGPWPIHFGLLILDWYFSKTTSVQAEIRNWMDLLDCKFYTWFCILCACTCCNNWWFHGLELFRIYLFFDGYIHYR